jgi:hypothetical protein
VALLAVPFSAIAFPTNNNGAVVSQPRSLLSVRQRKAPPPCVRMNPPPTQEETNARFAAFVEVFVGKSKSISKAFEYIAADYIVGLPLGWNCDVFVPNH